MQKRDEAEETVEAPPEEPAQAAQAKSALEEMLEQPSPAPIQTPAGISETLVGEVVGTKHPSLRGRVRVRWKDLEGQIFEKWLATLHGLPVREADRVLLTQASNWPERVVTGVLDGFARRPEVERESAAQLELKRDEALRVRSPEGEDLIEVFQDERGPVVRFLDENVDLELGGKLRVRAKSIELTATEGQARIKASDDVVVNGETIHLN